MLDQIFVRKDGSVAEGKALHRTRSGVGRIGIEVGQMNLIAAITHADDQGIVTVRQALGDVANSDAFTKGDSISLVRHRIVINAVDPISTLIEVQVITVTAYKLVITSAGDQCIIAIASRNPVGSAGSLQDVIPFTTDDIETLINHLTPGHDSAIIELEIFDGMRAVWVSSNEVVNANGFAGSGDIQQQLTTLRVVTEADVIG
ncbi:MAG: hypothetical protein WCR32_07140, partial [Geobacter sp.]